MKFMSGNEDSEIGRKGEPLLKEDEEIRAGKSKVRKFSHATLTNP